MGLSLVATALSSINIPTGLLWVSSAVFQLFVIFSGFSALYFAGIQQSSRIFIEAGGGGGIPAATGGWHLNAPLPPWQRAWGHVEVPKAPGSGCGVCGGGYSTTKADYVDKIIAYNNWCSHWTEPGFNWNDKTACVCVCVCVVSLTVPWKTNQIPWVLDVQNRSFYAIVDGVITH